MVKITKTFLQCTYYSYITMLGVQVFIKNIITMPVSSCLITIAWSKLASYPGNSLKNSLGTKLGLNINYEHVKKIVYSLCTVSTRCILGSNTLKLAKMTEWICIKLEQNVAPCSTG